MLQDLHREIGDWYKLILAGLQQSDGMFHMCGQVGYFFINQQLGFVKRDVIVHLLGRLWKAIQRDKEDLNLAIDG